LWASWFVAKFYLTVLRQCQAIVQG